MDIFIDTANLAEIQKWLDMGVIDGVTTNPSIMLKDGVHDVHDGAVRIASLINPRPLSVEVSTNDLEEMVIQAEEYASWAPNIVVKVPQINQSGEPCYGVIGRLEKEGIRVNATVALSLGQVVLSAKAGATYISLFLGRISDEGGSPSEVIGNSSQWLRRWSSKSRIIVGSIRSVGDVLTAVLAGTDIVTIPPQFLGKMADHQYTRETVRQFVDDARRSLAQMQPAHR